MKSKFIATTLAVEFLRELKDEVGPQDYREIKRRNSLETDRRVCHSHDFCDANMVMERAMSLLGLKTEGPERVDDWNDAWGVALEIMKL